MFRNLTIVVIILATCVPSAYSVTYTFTPSAAYTGSLEMDAYTEHQINVYHDLSDSAYISWRLIEDDYPDGWDVQLCDWQHCYSYLPFLGDMLGVPVGGSGYVRLLVNPMNIPGTGHLQFWIYPTGNMDAHVDIDFYLNTVVAHLEATLQKETKVSLDNAGNIILRDAPFGITSLYDAKGSLIKSWNLRTDIHTESFARQAGNVFIVQTADRKTFRIFIP